MLSESIWRLAAQLEAAIEGEYLKVCHVRIAVDRLKALYGDAWELECRLGPARAALPRDCSDPSGVVVPMRRPGAGA